MTSGSASATLANAPARARWTWLMDRPGPARIGVILVLLVLWEAGARLFGDPLFIAPPSLVAVAFTELVTESRVLIAVGRTAYELVAAFVLAAVVGLTIGLAVGLSAFARAAVFPIILMLYSTPQSPFLPLFILIFGVGVESKIAYGFTHGVFVLIATVVAGVQNIDPALMRAAHSMGASRRQIITSIVMPYMLRSFFTGMRLAMTGVLLGVLLAELYVSSGGIGYFTHLYTSGFKPANLLALIAMLAIIAITLNETCRRAEIRFSHWREV
jgi:ABC-type nitrate/sulfonate/bicarbonate transport system permease component